MEVAAGCVIANKRCKCFHKSYHCSNSLHHTWDFQNLLVSFPRPSVRPHTLEQYSRSFLRHAAADYGGMVNLWISRFIQQECHLNLKILLKVEMEFDEDFKVSANLYGELFWNFLLFG